MIGDGRRDDPERPQDPEPAPLSTPELERRRAELDRRLGQYRSERAEPRRPDNRTGGMQGIAQGLKIASEFVAGIIVGGFIGYGVDYLFGTGPFGLIVFLMIGFAAGVLNVVRGSKVGGSDGGLGGAAKKHPARRD